MNRNKALLLKRKLKEIKSYKGEGTQLISLYLPPNADRSSVTKQLTDEASQSSNIKSQHTRKNVQAALKRIINYLRQIDFKLPENGLVLFSGNVSENPSKTDVILLIFEPPKTLKSKLYWCDSSFHIAPLEELIQSEEVYGIVAIDKREATVAILNGKSYTIVNHTTSGVPGKSRAGGQSAARFERLREKAAQDFYKRVAEKINTSYVGLDKFKGMVLGGPGLTKQAFIDQGSLDHRIKDKVLGTVDTCYTNESGIKEILDKCTDILKDVGIVKERNLIDNFLEQVAKNQLATYGFIETIDAIKQGKASVVLVSEAIEWNILKFKCSSCNIEIPKIVKDKDNVQKVEKDLEHSCPNCGKPMELIEEVDFFDYIVDLTQPMGGVVELISTETSEGSQFYSNFGGVATLLRYK